MLICRNLKHSWSCNDMKGFEMKKLTKIMSSVIAVSENSFMNNLTQEDEPKS